jgi:MAGE family
MEVKELEKRVKNKLTKSGTYVLISTLSPELREASVLSPQPMHTLLTVILTLLYPHQKSLPFQSLVKFLAPFGINDQDTHPIFGKLEACILRWAKEAYLVKGKIVDGDYPVSWGGRAEMELGMLN